MSYTVGERVLAIRNTEEHPEPGQKRKLYVFGEGTYIGDQPRPGTEGPVPEVDAEVIREMFAEDDKVPVEKHRAVAFVIAANELEGRDPAPEVEKVVAKITENRARSMEERVEEMYRESSKNPCINLDNGFQVWGFQSWWGPADRAREKFPADVFEYVEVPVPEGNARWDVP